MNVYIVRGTCGEYSDHREWVVKAFTEEQSAKQLCDVLNAWCVKNGVAPARFVHAPSPLPICPLDPRFDTDYTGTEYVIWSIPVEGT